MPEAAHRAGPIDHRRGPARGRAPPPGGPDTSKLKSSPCATPHAPLHREGPRKATATHDWALNPNQPAPSLDVPQHLPFRPKPVPSPDGRGLGGWDLRSFWLPHHGDQAPRAPAAQLSPAGVGADSQPGPALAPRCPPGVFPLILGTGGSPKQDRNTVFQTCLRRWPSPSSLRPPAGRHPRTGGSSPQEAPPPSAPLTS